jgi:hypothetical protein
MRERLFLALSDRSNMMVRAVAHYEFGEVRGAPSKR